MRTFSIRLEDELYQKLETARGNRNKADYIREVLEENLREPQENLKEPQENLKEPHENHSGSQESEVAYLRSENTKLRVHKPHAVKPVQNLRQF